MYNSSGFIPARFLTLIAHFSISIILIWNSKEIVKSCLPMNVVPEAYYNSHTELMVGLGLVLAMICFEMLFFLIGVTMFHSTSALLSIGGHALSCICLCYFILDSWQCGWFWWIFSLGSALPFMHDIYLISYVFLNKKY